MEQWKDIPGYEGYYLVSESGRVWSVRAQREMKLGERTNGYLYATLSVEGVAKKHNVHSLVASAFLGERPEGLVTCHFDGNKKNNHFTNLRYDTQSANCLDTVRYGNNPERKKTHCPRGHELSESNIRLRKKGDRYKRECKCCARALSLVGFHPDLKPKIKEVADFYLQKDSSIKKVKIEDVREFLEGSPSKS